MPLFITAAKIKTSFPAFIRARFPEKTILLSLLLVAGSIWAFVEVADLVVEGASQSFDERAMLALRESDKVDQPVGGPWLLPVARSVTDLGSIPFLSAVTVAVLGLLALQHRYAVCWLVLASVGGGMIVSTVLKHLFARPRPSLVPHLTEVASLSFPSGHSMLSAVTYLTLGALLARTTSHFRLKICILSLATLLSVAIGLSRIYLGVHYPTDVLAGWCAGLAWALICAVIAHWLQKSGAVEPPARTQP